MSNSLKRTFATVLAMVLIVGFLPLKALVRADVSEVYYIYTEDGSSEKKVGTELPSGAEKVCVYVAGGTYDLQEDDENVWVSGGTVNASFDEVWNNYGKFKLAGTGKVVTDGITLKTNENIRPAYDGEINYEDLYDYFYNHGCHYVTEFTSDFVYSTYSINTFDEIVIPEGVTLTIAPYEDENGELHGTYLTALFMEVFGTLNIEGVQDGMEGVNTLEIGDHAGATLEPGGVVAGGPGACIDLSLSSNNFANLKCYMYDEEDNLVEVPADEAGRLVYDPEEDKWIESNMLDAVGFYKAQFNDFGNNCLYCGDKVISPNKYFSYGTDEEFEFTIEVPAEREGNIPEVNIISNNGCKSEKPELTENGSEYTFSFAPDDMKGFTIDIKWSEFDAVYSDDEHFVLDINCSGSIRYGIETYSEVFTDQADTNHKRYRINKDALEDGVVITLTLESEHDINELIFNGSWYALDLAIKHLRGFHKITGGYEIVLDNYSFDYGSSWIHLDIYADDAGNSQQTETGTLLVNYVPIWDYEFNPLAYVEIDGEIVESETDFEFVPGEELTFTIHAPEDREGVERCVQIFSDDGEYYTSNLPFGSGNNLEVVNDQFTFTPPDNKNYIVIVDWSEYDYYRGEKNLLLVETEAYGEGEVSVDKEDFSIANPANENCYKHIVPSFNLSDENPARVFFVAGKDAELTAINLQINDEPMVTYVPEWSEWYADANLMSEDPHFELYYGTWTYKLTEPNDEKCVYKFIVNFETPEEPEAGNFTVNSGDIGVQYAFVKDGVQGNFIDLDDKLVLESEDAADKIVLKFLPSAGQTLPSLRIQRTIMGAIMNPQIVQVNSDNTVVLEKGDYYWGTWTVDFADGSKILPYEFMIKAVGSDDYDPLADYKKDVIYGYAEDYVIELDFGDETPYMVVVYPNWGDAITLEAQSDGKYYYAPEMLTGFLIKVYEDYDAYEFDSVCAGEGETEFMFNMFFEGYPENTIPSSKISMLSPLKNTAFSEDGSKVKVVVSDDLDAFSWKITLGDEAFNYVVMLNGRDITGQVVSNDGILTVEKSVFEDDMDLSITVNYRKTFEITSEYNEGGSVSVPATAKEGKTVTVNATAFDGYVVDSIKVNNEVISGNEFVMPSENVKVEVVFRRLQYTVTLNEVFNGTASVSATSAKPGDEIVITYAPAEGYELDEVNVVGAELVGNKFTMPAADVIVTITFKKADYSVSLSQGIKNCEATLSKTTANYGDEITVDIVPAEGYKVLGIKVNGAAINDTKFTMPAEDVTVDVILQKIDYRISVSDTVGGTVSVAETANYGDEITITVTPDEGYELDTLKVNGKTISGNKFTMPAADVTVEVTFKKTETVKNGWILENGVYYFYKNGELAKGWIKDGNSWYYMDQSNGAMVTGWKQIGGVWYYFASSGAMITGWRQIGGTWYYFDNSGAMATGWKSVGGKWYYFNNGGAMVTGWKSIGGVWYFFGSSGAMTTGWAASGGKWYYFASSGAMVTGWIELGGKWYYLKSDGSMASDEYCGGYYLNEDGTWTKTAKADWKKDSVGWYYQDTTGWYAKNEKIKIDGKVYDFNAAGYCTNP